MKLIIYQNNAKEPDWAAVFYKRFCKEFLEPNFQVEYKEPIGRTECKFRNNIYKTSTGRTISNDWYTIAIENQLTNKLTVLTTLYNPTYLFSRNNYRVEDIECVLTAHYEPDRIHAHSIGKPFDNSNIWKPWIFRPLFWEDISINPYKNIRQDVVPINKLYFRGFEVSTRKKVLRELVKIKDPNNHNIISCKPLSYEYKKYAYDLINHKIALSLPGAGDMCNRDIECFGLGVPMLRPEFCAILSNKIPNEAYIKVPYMKNKNPVRPEIYNHPIYPEKLAKDILNKFEEIRHDDKLLNDVSKAGRQYYEETCAWPKSGESTLKMLPFNA